MTGIPASESQERPDALLPHVEGEGLSGYVLFDEKYLGYAAAFGFLATERPVAFAGNTSGDVVVFVPEFEVEPVRRDRVRARRVLPRAPGREHPIRILARVPRDLGLDGVGADQDGYPGILGYEGPPQSRAGRCGLRDPRP